MPTQAATLTTLETITDASVPETILPIQYFDRLTARVTDVPEKRLMFAVLLDAVIHLQRRDSRGAAEAVEWIEGEPDGSVFSFQNICESLGLEPTGLARALLAWHHGPRTARLGRTPATDLHRGHAALGHDPARIHPGPASAGGRRG